MTVALFAAADEKFGGNVLNCRQIENEYAIANKTGDIKIVSKRVWQISYILTVLLFVAVILGTFVLKYDCNTVHGSARHRYGYQLYAEVCGLLIFQ